MPAAVPSAMSAPMSTGVTRRSRVVCGRGEVVRQRGVMRRGRRCVMHRCRRCMMHNWRWIAMGDDAVLDAGGGRQWMRWRLDARSRDAARRVVRGDDPRLGNSRCASGCGMNVRHRPGQQR